ncbi:hypothetical protein ACFQGT_02925 [Natrialbaceae archaeon GCM10025810]|uniref:hypothetical protein n=1 Tax=Halovalidus salilacus TaxID=3075124 RepID=UPI00361260E4
MSDNEDVPRVDPDDPPEIDPDDLEVGGLDELLPAPLLPVYRQFERVQDFRETHGPTYTSYLEAILAVALIGGYVYWLYLFLVAG